MKHANLTKKLESLAKRPSFTIEEAEQKGVSRRMLSYYVGKGILQRLSAGIYCLADQELQADFQWEDLIRLIYKIPSATVCLITALSLYDLTDEISREFWIAIPHEQKMRTPDKVRLIRMRDIKSGRTQYKIGKYKIAIFDKERTIIDTFRYLDKEVAIKALKRLVQQGIDYKKLNSYAKKFRINITPYLLTVTT